MLAGVVSIGGVFKEKVEVVMKAGVLVERLGEANAAWLLDNFTVDVKAGVALKPGITIHQTNPPGKNAGGIIKFKYIGMTVAELTINKRSDLHEYLKKLTRGKYLDSLQSQLSQYGLALEDVECRKGSRR